jgi:hypothetical protein
VRRITGLNPLPKRDKLEGSRWVCVPRDQDPLYAMTELGLEVEQWRGSPVSQVSHGGDGWMETPEEVAEWDAQLDEWKEQSATRLEAWRSRRMIARWFSQTFKKDAA